MNDTIVILGKRTVRQSERPHLETFARALVTRGKQLVTTRTEGVATVIAEAYTKAGGTPQYLTGANYRDITGGDNVIVFTDTKYQAQLDEKEPGWKTKGWVVIHNPKATEQAAMYLTQLLDDLGTPLEASA